MNTLAIQLDNTLSIRPTFALLLLLPSGADTLL